MLEMENGYENREAAIAPRPSLQPNFKPAGVSQAQLSKFQELHRRRLQIKGSSKLKTKSKGISGETSKSCIKKLDAKDFTEEFSTEVSVDSSVPIWDGNTFEDTFSQHQANAAAAVHAGAKKRQKLHWGLDTKERWERKANM